MSCRPTRQTGPAPPATGAPAAAAAPGLTVAAVLRAALAAEPRPRLPAHHWKTLGALLACHTPALGGHLYRCADCGQAHFVPHSCRNRHCPACQKSQADAWRHRQEAALLPVPYFHVVFTLPHALNALIAHHQRALYGLLFGAASATLLQFGRRRLRAQLGITAVLHTWSQSLGEHYHLHCIVSGGGLALDGSGWQAVSGRYLFPVKALSTVFKAKFRNGLARLEAQGELAGGGAPAPDPAWRQARTEALRRPWVVYIKRPFAGPRQVLAYLSRYTHRVALGSGRLVGLDRQAGTVSFTYKDYAEGARRKTMTLPLAEFLRRFCRHILPARFVKIRHYGLLANHGRTARLAQARALLSPPATPTPPTEPTTAPPPGIVPMPHPPPPPPLRCPHCGGAHLRLLAHFAPRRSRPALEDTS